MMPSLHIDGVAHDIGALAIFDLDEHLPGGLTWTLELQKSLLEWIADKAYVPRTARPSRELEKSLLALLRRMGRGDRPPRFCITSIDAIEVLERHVLLSGRCAPLIVEVLGTGGPTSRCGWREIR